MVCNGFHDFHDFLAFISCSYMDINASNRIFEYYQQPDLLNKRFWNEFIEFDWVVESLVYNCYDSMHSWRRRMSRISFSWGCTHVFPMGYRWSHPLPSVSPWSPASPAIDRCGRLSSPAPGGLAARFHVTDGKKKQLHGWKSPGNHLEISWKAQVLFGWFWKMLVFLIV